MAWLGLDAPNITTGWAPPPKLTAPEGVAKTVGEILQQRRYEQALTQKNIADTIKNVQAQRESQAYLEAAQQAGILPEGDLGPLGVKGASLLAQEILRKKEADARAAHLAALTAHVGSGRGRGGGGGGGDESVQVEAPEDYYGLSVAPGAPSKATTRVINGIVHVQDKHGGWKPGPKWMQQGAGQDGTAKPTDIAKAVKEQMSVQDQFDLLEKDRKKQEAEDIAAGRANVPFKQSDLYNLERNRLEQLKAMPGMPSTAAPGASPTPPPADTAAGHAEGYGVQGVKMQAPDGTVKTVSPDQVDYYKAKGAVIVQ